MQMSPSSSAVPGFSEAGCRSPPKRRLSLQPVPHTISAGSKQGEMMPSLKNRHGGENEVLRSDPYGILQQEAANFGAE